MEYIRDSIGTSFYLRCDKGEDILECILKVCKSEKILSASFSGIGCCSDVTLSVIDPTTNQFEPYQKTGILEMTSINGNISADDSDEIFIHAHAMFSYKDENNEFRALGGHLLKAMVAYTGQIIIHPVIEATIRRQLDPKTGITVWKF